MSVAGHLEQPTRAAGLETDVEPGCPARGRPYLVLLPVGFTVPRPLPARAVRSYRTLSPLLPRTLRFASAVCFLWHFPWGYPRRPLAATVSPWSPDFPPPILLEWTTVVRNSGSGRPAGWYPQ